VVDIEPARLCRSRAHVQLARRALGGRACRGRSFGPSVVVAFLVTVEMFAQWSHERLEHSTVGCIRFWRTC
jgi:hypothetical protein